MVNKPYHLINKPYYYGYRTILSKSRLTSLFIVTVRTETFDLESHAIDHGTEY